MPVENIWNELQMGKNIERPKQHEEYRAWPKSLIHTREFQKERKKEKKRYMSNSWRNNGWKICRFDER